MKGLRTCIYKVNDLQRAKSWYSETFRKQPYFDEPFYVGFNIGGYELGLLPVEEQESIVQGNNMLVYWGVEDIHKEYGRLIKLGAKEEEPPHGVGGPLMVATVRDPWQNIIGLIYNPEFRIE